MAETDVAAQLNAVLERTRAKADQWVRVITMEADRRLIEKTPVDTGRAAGNWNIGVDAADNTWSDLKRPGPRPELPEGVGLGHRIYLTNSVPYIELLEYGGYPNPPKRGKGKTIGGYSRQAPQGMVRITAVELAPVAEEIAQKIAAGFREAETMRGSSGL